MTLLNRVHRYSVISKAVCVCTKAREIDLSVPDLINLFLCKHFADQSLIRKLFTIVMQTSNTIFEYY